ncbi:MAG: hypothetical protein J6W03_04425 [Bacteroidaceae bacterium]|nr:hypothetical protein [Bacteroidaceae bacterium]
MKTKLLTLFAALMMAATVTAQVTYTATAGTDFEGGEGTAKLFDNDVNTKFCGNTGSDVYVLVTASEPVFVWGYEMTTASDTETYGRLLKQWALYGTNDETVAADPAAEGWVALSDLGENNLVQRKNFYTQRFFCEKGVNKPFKYFKLTLTGGGFIQFSEFKILGEPKRVTVYKWKDGSQANSQKAFDLLLNQKWEGNNLSNNWLTIETKDGQAYAVKSYSFTTHDDGDWNNRAPKSWKIEGSNDNSTWVTLDDVTDGGIQNLNYKTFEYTPSNTTDKFRYIKLTLRSMLGTGWTQVGEFHVLSTSEFSDVEHFTNLVNNAKATKAGYEDLLGATDPWCVEYGTFFDALDLDAALEAGISSGDYDALEAKLKEIDENTVGQAIALFANGANCAAIAGTATWSDGSWTQLLDGKDGTDGQPGTKWGGNFEGSNPQYVIFRAKQAFAPYFYKLVTGGDTYSQTGRNWKTWSVYGANFSAFADATADATAWVELDKRENIDTKYLPNENNYPAAFDFNQGVTEPYLYYMVKVFASAGGTQQQMNEMYLCTQDEFEAIREPLVDEFEDFAATLDALVVESSVEADKAEFATLYDELKTTADAVRLTEVYNELQALKRELEESALFLAGAYRSLSGNTAYSSGEAYNNLVDGNVNTKWAGIMPSDGAYNIFKAYAENAFGQYMLVTGNDTEDSYGRNWKTWKVYGANFSDDASATRTAEDWTLIDQKADIGQDLLPAANFAPAFFNISEEWTTGYKYFKVEVETAYDGDAIQMAEFKFLTDEEYATIRQEYVDSLNTLKAELGTIPTGLVGAIDAKIAEVAGVAAGALLPTFEAVVEYLKNEAPALIADAQPALVDGVYQIANALQLITFGEIVNGGETEANAVVVGDIDLDGYTWTPIGNETTKYAGTFDGQGHAITNFAGTTDATVGKYGLFGNINGATVKNFRIAGTLTVPAASAHGSGVVGWATSATISNIHSSLVIEVGGNEAHHVGGIVGSLQDGVSTVSNCSFAGSLTVADGSTDCFGGIVGYMSSDAVTNCANYGTVEFYGANCYGGGIVGYINNANPTVANCLSIGTVAYKGEGTASWGGAIIGRHRKNAANVMNNYWLEGSAAKPSSDIVLADPAAISVTAEQLASGKIAYLLNECETVDVAWFQTLSMKNFVAEQYVVTADGTTEEPTVADVTLSDAGDGTYTFTLPNFTLKILGMSLPVGDISLEGVEVAEDGTFNKTGTYAVPAENIPAALSTYASFFQNIPYTLTGKVNNDKLYAVIDLTVNVGGAHTVNVVAGVDDFDALAPALTCDQHPVLDATHKVVYMDGRLHCNGDVYEDAIFTNDPTEAPLQDDHDFVCGFCTYCGAIDETYDGIYEIATAAQLKSFATVVNTMNNAADAIVVADIDMTGAGWPKPIGDWSSGDVSTAYAGHFDGQGHAITNLKYTTAQAYHGLFGVITEGALIENFSISGDITTNVQYVGVVAYARETPVIKNVHSFINITNSYAGGRQGGILGGSMNGTVTIERCWYSGKLIAGELSGNYGGIVGYINNNSGAYCNITDCLFDGVLYNGTAGGQCGGVVGYNNGGKATLTNCLSIGTLTSGAAGQFFGALNGNNSTYVNCYYQGTVAQTGTGTPKGETPVTVTDEELESGEICTALGDAWGQDLGTDAYPHPVPEGSKTGLYLEIAVSEVGYATFVPKYNVAVIPEGVTAFVAQNMGTYVHLEEVTALPAENAFVVKADEGVYYCDVTTEALTLTEANDLLFSAEDVEANGTQFVLAKPEGEEVGFYRVTTGTFIKPFKGYLVISDGDAKAFYGFDPDNGTGIAEVEKAVEDGAIYNLAGQRISKMQRGINIINGKKVLK